jgi:hypothetical protein
MNAYRDLDLYDADRDLHAETDPYDDTFAPRGTAAHNPPTAPRLTRAAAGASLDGAAADLFSRAAAAPDGTTKTTQPRRSRVEAA